jgi:hypothetical protein
MESKMEKIENLFSEMWENYVSIVPQAKKIVNLLELEGETVVNDHIALRTFNLPEVSIDVIAKPFIDSGYFEGGEYHFEEKKLYAKHFEHKNPSYPKVFISELLIEKFSAGFQDTVKKLISEVTVDEVSKFDFTISGRSWDLSTEEYESLNKESNYGAWLAAIGYRPNHFTILINKLNKFNSVEELNSFLKGKDIKLNSAGGEVKGSPEVLLEQSSTLADNIEMQFTDKSMTIPTCYFEFAKRYELASGGLYQGFVAQSADKIFESTNKGQ